MDTFKKDMMLFVEKLEKLGQEREKKALDDRQLNETARKEMDAVRKEMAKSNYKSLEISVDCRGFVNANNFLYSWGATEPKHDSKFHASCFEWAGHCLAYAQPDSMELLLGLETRAHLHYHCGNWEECRMDANAALDLIHRCKFSDKTAVATVKMLEELLIEVVKHSRESYVCYTAGDESMHMWRILNPRYEEPKLKPRAHPRYPCLHEGVEPAYSPERGRHLVATRDIKAGEMILVEKLACGVLTQKVAHTKCAHCLAQAWAGPACDKCVNAVYCTEKCRNEAWSEYHDVECELLQLMNDKDREVNLGALRLLIKYIKKDGLEKIIQIAETIDRNRESFHEKLPIPSECAETPETEYCSNNFDSIYGLLDRANYDEEGKKFECFIKKLKDRMEADKDRMDVDKDKMDVDKEEKQEDCMETDEFPDKKYDLVLENVLRKIKSKDKDKQATDIDDDTMKAVRRIFNKLKMIFLTNHSYFGWVPDRKSITTTTLDINSFALSYYSSLINHSCFHNCMMSIGKGGKLIVFALYPIKKDEEITISYVNKVTWNLNAKIRKLNLALQKSFICRCQGCVEDWSLPDGPVRGSLYVSTSHRRNVAQAELGLKSENGNTWYLTEEQINALKTVINDYFKDLKETSPMIALKLADVYIRCLIQTYHLMYGVECAAPEECHKLKIEFL